MFLIAPRGLHCFYLRLPVGHHCFHGTHLYLHRGAILFDHRVGTHLAHLGLLDEDKLTKFRIAYRGLSWTSFFTLDNNIKGTRGHSWKLAKFRCTRDCCILAYKYFFSNRVIIRWNQLDQRAVGASSINAFKGCLNKIREKRMGFFMDWSAEF